MITWYIQEPSAANGINYLHRMYMPHESRVECVAVRHPIIASQTCGLWNACWRGCAALQLTSTWLGLQSNGSHDDGMSVNATLRERNRLEQLMPLNTVRITIAQRAHSPQRVDSVQVAEIFGSTHVITRPLNADVSMSLRQSRSLSCECFPASLCSFSNLASSYFPS